MEIEETLTDLYLKNGTSPGQFTHMAIITFKSWGKSCNLAEECIFTGIDSNIFGA